MSLLNRSLLTRIFSNPAVWFFLFACYAATAAILRLTFRETVIGDDAESFLWARSLEWGYGPQPPAYAWMHWAIMQVTGETALTSAATRAVAQFAVPTAAFLLASRFAPVHLAGAAALAIFISPEFGRAIPLTRSNNILASALTPIIVLAFLVWMEKQRYVFALLLGLASALAILSKATAALVVLSLPISALLSSKNRRNLHLDQLGAAIALTLLLISPYFIWLIYHASIGTASLSKFKFETSAWDGLSRLAKQMLASWGPTCLLVGVGWGISRKKMDLPVGFSLVWRMAGIALSLIVLGIVLTESGDIHEHWLAPIFMPVIPVVVAVLLQREGAIRWLPSLIGGILAVVGLAVLPKEFSKRGFDRLDLLRANVEEIALYKPDLVLATLNAAANVVLIDPTLNVRERTSGSPVDCSGTVALLTIERPRDPAALDLESFIMGLQDCAVEILAHKENRPDEASISTSFAVLRLSSTSPN